MIKKIYVHNFRCLENFELNFNNKSSLLLIGGNGSGKSTIGKVFELLQSIGRGINRMRELDRRRIITLKDFTQNRCDVPMRFEIEVSIENILFRYALAFELPQNFKELRILEEQLDASGNPVYSRQGAQVTLSKGLHNQEAQFLVDWHRIALPIIQEQSETDPLRAFKSWISRMIILAPIPSLMSGESSGASLEPERDGKNFGMWFSELLSRYPATYTLIEKYLRNVMPDIQDFVNEPIGKDAKNMLVRFESLSGQLTVDFSNLSDGEKCFFLCAVVLAANSSYGPLFCFWDEPDSHLALSEVGHFITELRRSFKDRGQLLVTSHNQEAIRKFSTDNTYLIFRKSHLEPALIRLLQDVQIDGNVIDNIVRGDIEL